MRVAIWQTVGSIALTLQSIPAAVAICAAVIGGLSSGFEWSAVATGIFGLCLGVMAWLGWRWISRPLGDSIAVTSAGVASGWVLASCVCAIPFWVISWASEDPDDTLGAFLEPINAWYESTSSITSCGLTVTASSEALPPILQLFRSGCQWAGGVGLAVFAIMLLENMELGKTIYRAETRSWQRSGRLRPTVVSILQIYIGLTLLCGAAYFAFGMPAWEAINHALITASTGGLTVTDDSFTSYNGAIKLVACVVMWFGALSFGIVFLLSRGNWSTFVSRTVSRHYAVWSASCLLLLVIVSWANMHVVSFSDLFNLLSALSTCGVNSGSVADSPVVNISVPLAMLAMFVGGCGDSTAGGIKLNTLVWIIKNWRAQLSKTLFGQSSGHLKWNGNLLKSDEICQRNSRVITVVFSFFAVAVIGFVGMRLSYPPEITSQQVLFQTLSALGTVGLTLDLNGPERPALAKLIEAMLMLIGRLEVISVVLLLPVWLGWTDRQYESKTGNRH